MSTQRIIIAAGGTGGHLFPAQALAQQLQQYSSPSDILFVSGGLGKNRYFDRDKFLFKEISSSPLISKNPFKCIKGMACLIKGIKDSVTVIKKHRPDIVVGFGSYYTIPVLIAAKWLKIPIVLHEANSIPGRANLWLSPLAHCVGVHFPSTASSFKCKTFEVGLPLREGYQKEKVDRLSSLAYFGLSSKMKTLLIFGGSQGAKAINDQIEKCIPQLTSLSFQIIHLTGDEKKTEILRKIYEKSQIPACVKSFETQMQMAWRAADAFIGRSGASTIAESIEFEVPGILIPYPHATDNHQEKNADFLVETVKSARKLLESELDSDKLLQTLKEFIQNDLHLSMEALKFYKKRPSQLTLCQLILKMCQDIQIKDKSHE